MASPQRILERIITAKQTELEGAKGSKKKKSIRNLIGRYTNRRDEICPAIKQYLTANRARLTWTLDPRIRQTAIGGYYWMKYDLDLPFGWNSGTSSFEYDQGEGNSWKKKYTYKIEVHFHGGDGTGDKIRIFNGAGNQICLPPIVHPNVAVTGAWENVGRGARERPRRDQIAGPERDDYRVTPTPSPTDAPTDAGTAVAMAEYDNFADDGLPYGYIQSHSGMNNIYGAQSRYTLEGNILFSELMIICLMLSLIICGCCALFGFIFGRVIYSKVKKEADAHSDSVA